MKNDCYIFLQGHTGHERPLGCVSSSPIAIPLGITSNLIYALDLIRVCSYKLLGQYRKKLQITQYLKLIHCVFCNTTSNSFSWGGFPLLYRAVVQVNLGTLYLHSIGGNTLPENIVYLWFNLNTVNCKSSFSRGHLPFGKVQLSDFGFTAKKKHVSSFRLWYWPSPGFSSSP